MLKGEIMREPRPITRVEVSEKNRKARIIAAVILLVVGAVSLATGFVRFLNKDSGWQRVEVTPEERSCSESFILRYHFPGSAGQAKAVNTQLEALYAEGCVKAYQLFTPDEAIDGVQNVYYINRHPNETITVDPLLYEAFEKLEGMPYLYLGPAYSYYYNLILNVEENQIHDLDPLENAEAAAYLSQIAEFAADRSVVHLELLGGNQIKLNVSDAYLQFAAEEEIESFIDFGYMTNAFIIDYLAEQMIALGLTDGYLVSVDGFTRNLDSENTFSFHIYDKVEQTVCNAASMQYQGPVSMVFLKSYPTALSDANYRVNGGRFVHLMTDPADGVYRTSTDNLVSYSYDLDCVDVMLKMLPCFVSSEFSVPEDVYSVWVEEEQICYNDDTVSFQQLLQSEEISYQAVLKK